MTCPNCKRMEAVDSPAMVEKLAALAHEQWSGWTKYLLSKMEPWGHDREYLLMNKVWSERWSRQIATPYANLSDEEKESDRKEARRIIAALSESREEYDRTPSAQATKRCSGINPCQQLIDLGDCIHQYMPAESKTEEP